MGDHPQETRNMTEIQQTAVNKAMLAYVTALNGKLERELTLAAEVGPKDARVPHPKHSKLKPEDRQMTLRLTWNANDPKEVANVAAIFTDFIGIKTGYAINHTANTDRNIEQFGTWEDMDPGDILVMPFSVLTAKADPEARKAAAVQKKTDQKTLVDNLAAGKLTPKQAQEALYKMLNLK